MTNADKLTDKTLELINHMQQAVPHIADLSLASVRVDAVCYLLIGLIPSVIAIIFFSIAKKFNRKIKASENEKDKKESESIRDVFAIACFASSMASLIFLLNIWNWIAIFKPELYVAHKVTSKVLHVDEE